MPVVKIPREEAVDKIKEGGWYYCGLHNRFFTGGPGTFPSHAKCRYLASIPSLAEKGGGHDETVDLNWIAIHWLRALNGEPNELGLRSAMVWRHEEPPPGCSYEFK